MINTSVNGSNWMSTLDMSTPVTAFNIPGTHDSATKFCVASLFSQTQCLTIEEQLYAGVRYFDMRFKLKNEEFICEHGLTDCKASGGLFSKKLYADDTVAVCKNFLKQNPGETILFQLKEDNTSSGDAFFELFYKKYIENDKNSWFLENRTPTLAEAKGKMILLRAVSISDAKFNDQNSGINFRGYPYVGSTDTIDFRTGNISLVDDPDKTYAKLFVQDSYKQKPSQKPTAMDAFIESQPDRNNYNINMANCIGGFPSPVFTSYIINGFLKKYNFSGKGYFGIVAMDFVTDELCRKIYMCNEMPNTPAPATKCPSESKTTITEKLFNLFRFFIKI